MCRPAVARQDSWGVWLPLMSPPLSQSWRDETAHCHGAMALELEPSSTPAKSPQSHGRPVDSTKTDTSHFWAAVVPIPMFIRLSVVTFCANESFAGPAFAHLRWFKHLRSHLCKTLRAHLCKTRILHNSTWLRPFSMKLGQNWSSQPGASFYMLQKKESACGIRASLTKTQFWHFKRFTLKHAFYKKKKSPAALGPA